MFIKVLCKSLVVFLMLLVFGCPNPATEYPKGANADLTSLTVSAGTLNPIFTANTTNYTVNVPNTTAAITITGIKADANAEISDNNGVEQTLSDGANTITISVTAEDGVTVKDYVVTVIRAVAGSTNADLKDIIASTGTLTPIFMPETTNYTVVVPNIIDSITITGTLSDDNATMSTNSGIVQALSVGSNTIIIAVTAENGTTVKNYVVTVIRYGTDHSSVNIGVLKYVPIGRFKRGLTDTVTNLIATSFRMSQHEISRAQFFAMFSTDPVVLMESSASSSGTTDPVMMINWYHAISYCNKLSIAEDLTQAYVVEGVNFSDLSYDDIPIESNATWDAATLDSTATGYRLPTEKEWLWAAMGAPSDGQGSGINTAGCLKGYSGSIEGSGNINISNYGWYYGNSDSKTHPVGEKYANELDLYDMSGNVLEWCWNWNNSYPYKTNRVVRGGCYMDNAFGCRVDSSINVYPYVRNEDIGFRVIRP